MQRGGFGAPSGSQGQRMDSVSGFVVLPYRLVYTNQAGVYLPSPRPDERVIACPDERVIGDRDGLCKS
jgi:hypothetical protein